MARPGLAKITILGNVGSEPETRDVGSTTVTKFTIAVQPRFRKDDKPDWYRVNCWGKQGEFAQKFINKGKRILIIGDLSFESWKDKDGREHYNMEVRAEDIQFADSAPAQGGNGNTRRNNDDMFDGDDSDLPF